MSGKYERYMLYSDTAEAFFPPFLELIERKYSNAGLYGNVGVVYRPDSVAFNTVEDVQMLRTLNSFTQDRSGGSSNQFVSKSLYDDRLAAQDRLWVTYRQSQRIFGHIENGEDALHITNTGINLDPSQQIEVGQDEPETVTLLHICQQLFGDLPPEQGQSQEPNSAHDEKESILIRPGFALADLLAKSDDPDMLWESLKTQTTELHNLSQTPYESSDDFALEAEKPILGVLQIAYSYVHQRNVNKQKIKRAIKRL